MVCAHLWAKRELRTSFGLARECRARTRRGLGLDNRRATLTDIAAKAKVSKTTVDRVLNGRDGVKERTRNQVLSAAISLGYLSQVEAGVPKVIDVEELPARAPIVEPASPLVLDFVLPGGANMFITMLAAGLTRAAHKEGVEARVRSIKGFDPEALAEVLSGLAGQSQGIGVIGVDHPAVREAIRNVARSGVPVLTLVSDISNVATAGYVGIDNRTAGRLAGHLLGRFVGKRAGSVALFAGALAYRGHEEREMGFRHVLQERYPNLAIAVHREIQDDPTRAYAEAKAVLSELPDLVGLYNIGAGNRGVGQALSESGRAGDIVFVGHDLSEHTRRLLLSGVMDVAIDQNPEALARLSVQRLVAAVRGEVLAPLSPLPVLPVFSENIPADFGD